MYLFSEKQLTTYFNLMKIEKQPLEKAIQKFGKDAQLNMVVEESAELIKAIAKYKRSPNLQALNEIYDECADVLIMIEQVQLIFDCTSKIQERIDYKIERLKGKL